MVQAVRNRMAARRACCAVAALCLLLTASARAADLTLTTEDFSPPFNMIDVRSQTLVGISVEKLVELMKRAHLGYTFKVFPWARAYQMALQLPDTCVFSTTRTPAREALFTWIGPLTYNDWMLFARADEPRKPASLDEVGQRTIGGYRDDSTGDYLRQRGYRVDVAAVDANNPQKLLSGRIDFWATGELSGRYLIAKDDMVGKIVPLFKFNHAELYLACNLATGAALAKNLNQILKDMDRDGTNAAIDRKYR